MCFVATCLLPVMSVFDLLGLRYRLGADGSDGEIDCIHLVYAVQRELGIPTPVFKENWYEAEWREVARDLLGWGTRIPKPAYDGDVILMPTEERAFAVAWQQGFLAINHRSKRVQWLPLSVLPATQIHCFRLKNS